MRDIFGRKINLSGGLEFPRPKKQGREEGMGFSLDELPYPKTKSRKHRRQARASAQLSSPAMDFAKYAGVGARAIASGVKSKIEGWQRRRYEAARQRELEKIDEERFKHVLEKTKPKEVME